MTRSLRERFFEKIYYCPMSGCWLWGGFTSKSKKPGEVGYGLIRDNERKRPIVAHRISWELHYGPVPAGMCVCHTCDVRSCVNPKHLWLGTHADNQADKHAKGRANMPIGARNSRTKLTAANVVEILASNEHVRILAERYGVKYQAILSIRNGRTWRHISQREYTGNWRGKP